MPEVYLAIFIALAVYVYRRWSYNPYSDWDSVKLTFIDGDDGSVFFIHLYTHPAYSLPGRVLDMGDRTLCKYEQLCQDIAFEIVDSSKMETVEQVDTMLIQICETIIAKLNECHWPNKLPDTTVSIYGRYIYQKDFEEINISPI